MQAWFLVQAYKRRLRAIVAVAPGWMLEEILSASERIERARMKKRVTPAYRSFCTQHRYLVNSAMIRNLPDLDQVRLHVGERSLDTRVLADHIGKMGFIYLIALLEDYLLQALEILYMCNPTRLPMDRERTVRFRDILAAKSREELIEVMIAQEVRGVRRSLPEVINQFTRFSIDLGREGLELPHFIEMKEARNLFAHKGGRVDAEYLDRTEDYWRMVGEEPPEEGTEYDLGCSLQYLLRRGQLAKDLVSTIEAHIAEHCPSACTSEMPDKSVPMGDWYEDGVGKIPSRLE